MSPNIVQIGLCFGCDKRARLDDGVCLECLSVRGRRWAELSHRCRTEPEFAARVLSQIVNERGRALFLRMYGHVLRGTGAE